MTALESNAFTQIAGIRRFNRLHATRLGLLRRQYLDGSFSLTEARLLFEIGATADTTAVRLRQVLELDRGYISRTLATLTRRRLVRQTVSPADARERLLSLTAMGKKALESIDAQSTEQIAQWLEPLTEQDRAALAAALEKAHEILSRPKIQIERLSRETPEARRILAEYYEAVHVVQRDPPGAIQQIIDDEASGMWLATLDGRTVGCVVLRRMNSIPHAGECKRLYVRPDARGRGIADLLLDAQEKFAREQGLRWLYLDSYDDLKAAIALYRRRGFTDCKRYNDNPQATVFLRKKLR